MAEFMGSYREAARKADVATEAGMAAMGHPVPAYRKQAALDHCRAMGLTDTNKAMATVDRMAKAVALDEPYKAMEAGMVHLDLTGTYRLLAVLCTAPKPRLSVRAATNHEEGALS